MNSSNKHPIKKLSQLQPLQLEQLEKLAGGPGTDPCGACLLGTGGTTLKYEILSGWSGSRTTVIFSLLIRFNILMITSNAFHLG